MTGKAADALHMINTGMTALRSTGATMFSPLYLSYLARACVELGKFDDASHWISEAMFAMQTSKESWWEAEIDRIEGELALKSPLDVARAEVYLERALAVARQAKSWELRAAMSMARLWRDQGKPQQARELLAPIYNWFTEGFDTRDLKEAKALLEERTCQILGTNMGNDNSFSRTELNDRIAVIRGNIRQLVEQAAASSGAQDEERISGRIAQQQDELDKLIKERDAMLKK